jgi:hypothetical protein
MLRRMLVGRVTTHCETHHDSRCKAQLNGNNHRRLTFLLHFIDNLFELIVEKIAIPYKVLL